MISRIGKCRACKQTSRRDYTLTRPVSVGSHANGGMYRRTINQAGRMLPNQWLPASEDGWCPSCGERAWSAQRIEGFKVDTVPCDSRCTEAKGHKCDCSCGGANHGKGHLVCEAIAA